MEDDVALEHRARRQQRSAPLADHLPAVGAVGEMGAQCLVVRRLEGMQSVAGSQLGEALVVGGDHSAVLGSGRSVSMRVAASEISSSASRSRRIPASIRVLTVPSGVSVRPAISRCV